MKRVFVATDLLFPFIILASLPTLAAEFKFGAQTLTVPEGFEVQRVAGPPLVDRPIEADFDEQGRLYVTDSSGSNGKPDKQLELKPHRVVRLEDTDGDGKYDKRIVFADKLMFPEGAMWHDGSLYVAAPPSIWKLTDTDGDGVADQREEWFKGKTLTGCANDLHGPYAGPDGWIYWTKGAFAKQTYERPGKPPFVTRAAHIFRCRSDGSGFEPVMTGGMDNPVGLAFTSSGERIFSTTFFQQPAGGKRDGLVHAIYGGVYGKQHDVVEEHKRTGDLMPVLTHLGPAAPAGLTRYKSGVFGDAYRDNLFTSLFNLHKITRHVLTPYGATFRTEDSDFVVSDSTDFHPTDVLEDADGSLLVIDTGGWYKLCCPTSQLYKPDLLGAIYRIRKKGSPKIDDPRGLEIKWSDARSERLAKLAGDSRPAVQQRAIRELSNRGESSIEPLNAVLRDRKATTAHKINAIWALTQIDTAAARSAVLKFIEATSDRGPAEDPVRVTAIHSVSVWRHAPAAPELARLLSRTDSAHVKRACAEALGRIGGTQATSVLLDQTAKEHDRALQHSLTYALIECADKSGVSSRLSGTGVTAASERTERAALIALDQMDDGGLTADKVIPYLRSSSSLLRQTAEWIIGRRPAWAEAMVPFFEQSLKSSQATDEAKSQVERFLKSFASQPPVQSLLAEVTINSQTPKRARTAALGAMAQSGLKEMPSAWRTSLETLLSDADPELINQAVAVARALPAPKDTSDLSQPLLAIARESSKPHQLRLDALAALPSGNKLDDDLFQFATGHLSTSNAVSVRSAAVTVLSRARLSTEQLSVLAEVLKQVGPLEAPKVLTLFSKGTSEAVGMKLIQNLRDSAVLAAIPPQALRSCLTNFPPTVQEEGERLCASNGDSSKGDRLNQLLSGLPTGDVRRGQALFNSSSTACSSCHAIGYLGGNLGPDLTRIGQIRTERDLLEAIVYPSASFVRSYEPIVVLTKNGDQFSGVIRKDAPDEVVLASGPDAEARISRTEIAEMRPGTISIMPEGLEQQLSRQELSDLLAFLKATRW
jgi:putative membrane-bound dehydrogenase-like protein